MISKFVDNSLVKREIRSADRSLRRRKVFDGAISYLRSCAVCTSTVPPIDLLCPVCWRELGRVMNRAENLRQADFVFPTYALLTWTPTTARFVKPFIYGFKGGYNVRAAEKLGTLFLSEQLLAGRKSVNVGPKGPQKDLLLSAPSERFDHSQLWAKTLSNQLDTESFSPFLNPSASTTRQKELRQAERGDRRFILKEHFANLPGELTDAKRTVFADDVITTGSTAMAAYMALGDPDQFEVWALVARPRLAGK